MIKWSEESHSAHSLGFIRLTTKRLHYVFSGALIKSWYYNLWYCYKGHNIAHNNDPQALHSMKYQVSQSKAEKTRTTGTENLTTVRLQDLRWRNGWGTLDIPQRMICKHQNKFAGNGRAPPAWPETHRICLSTSSRLEKSVSIASINPDCK